MLNLRFGFRVGAAIVLCTVAPAYARTAHVQVPESAQRLPAITIRAGGMTRTFLVSRGANPRIVRRMPASMASQIPSGSVIYGIDLTPDELQGCTTYGSLSLSQRIVYGTAHNVCTEAETLWISGCVNVVRHNGGGPIACGTTYNVDLWNVDAACQGSAGDPLRYDISGSSRIHFEAGDDGTYGWASQETNPWC